IEHGNTFDAGRRVLMVLVPEDETLEIELRDRSSRRFPETVKSGAPPSLEDRLAGQAKRRGWGTFLIRSLVDEVEFSSTSKGNNVRMLIHLDSRSRGEPGSP